MRLATDRSGVLSVESGRVLPHLEMAGAAWLGYANDPLVLHRLGDQVRVASLIGDRTSGVLGAAVGFLDRGQLAIEVPVVLQQARRTGTVTPASVDAFGVGAIRLVPKVQLLDQEAQGVDLAVLAAFDVPTGARDFVGSQLTFQPEVALSRRLGEVRVAAGLGAAFRQKATLLDATMGNELSAQLGAAYDLKPRFTLPLEAGVVLASAVSASSPFRRSNETSIELRGYGAYDVSRGLRLLAGGGAGLQSGWGTPDWRIFAGAQFDWARPPVRATTPVPAAADATPPAAPAEPVVAEAPAPPAPPAAEPAPSKEPAALESAPSKLPAAIEAPPSKQPAASDLPPRAAAVVKLESAPFSFEERIPFDFASDAIRPDAVPLIDNLAKVIQAHPEIARVRVEGHTDAKGSHGYNEVLSEKRARSVVFALVSRGVAAERLHASAHAFDRPAAPNDTPAGRARNRRVEVHVAGPSTEGASR